MCWFCSVYTDNVVNRDHTLTLSLCLLPICRCEELKKKLASSEEELKWVNEQLLMAVQQKFKLQQQIEDWQVCMLHGRTPSHSQS